MLRSTLNSLAGQTDVNLSAFEVLIVDNNCTDHTADVVDLFRESLPIRRITETRQGLAHARNRAATECRGDVVIFTDDDIRFEPGWLAAYEDAIHRFPDADYFGGRILPDWRQAKPRWIRDRALPLIGGVLGWFDHGTETRPVQTIEQMPWGASFAIRRRLFEKIGLFRTDLGTGGSGLGRGEETEFFMRAKRAAARGVYVGEALCLHAYDPKRLKLAALYRHGIACGRSHNAIVPRPHCGTYRAAGWFVLRGLYQLVKGRGDRFRQCVINAGIEVGTRSDYVRR